MAMSLNALKKLTKGELSNMVIDYQNKFDYMLPNINAELTSLKADSQVGWPNNFLKVFELFSP